MKQSRKSDSSSNNFVDCKETIQIEGIKKEINEAECFVNTHSEVKEEVTDDVDEGIKFKDIKKEIKEEENAEDLLHIQGDTA